jgi:hypothetical protein
VDTEFAVDVFGVAFDGAGGDEELLADLLIIQTLGQQTEDLQFAFGEGIARDFRRSDLRKMGIVFGRVLRKNS